MPRSTRRCASGGGCWPGRRSRTSPRARTLRTLAGRRVFTDGPYAETTEQLGGFYLVDVDVARHPGGPDPAAARPLRRRGPPGGPRCRLRLRGPGLIDDDALTAAWRDEWGRLLALLVAQYRRLDLAEDGLGRRLRGRRPDLAARRRTAQPAGLAADRGPAADPRPAARRGGGRPEAAAAGRRGRPCRRRRSASWPMPARRCATSGCGWCCSARTPSLAPRRPPRSPCGWCSASRPRTSPGCSWSAPRPWPPG